jgi:hypothetical protein
MYWCKVGDCLWSSGLQESDEIAGYLATWHVYEEHRDVWAGQFGDRPPRDPDPAFAQAAGRVGLAHACDSC